MAATIHLRTHAPVAERVLLPGDPGRALRLAQALMTETPRMLNHNRGLWGYTGKAPDGELLTIQATGMGGPSAAIVVEELIELGARRIVRVGTCGALRGGFALGDLVAATEVHGTDGASRALGANGAQAPDPELLRKLLTHARAGTVVTSDLFYDPDPGRLPDGDVIEMETAAVLAVAARHGIAAAAVLLVSDLLAGPHRERIDEATLLAAELTLGTAGLASLT